jgi:hypothetical protein
MAFIGYYTDPNSGLTFIQGTLGGDRGYTDQREILVALQKQIIAYGIFTDPNYVNIGKRTSQSFPATPIDLYGADIFPGRKIVDQPIFNGSGTINDVRREVVMIRVYVQNGNDYSDHLEEWATNAYANAYYQARRVSEGVHGRDIVDAAGTILTIEPARVLSIGEPDSGAQAWSAFTVELEASYRERTPEMQ